MKLSDILQAMPDLSLVHEDLAVSAATSLPDFNPKYSKVVGTMDGHEVWLTRFFGEEYNTFAFREWTTLLAFIVVNAHPVGDAYPLVRLWTSPHYRGRGFVTALVLFVTKKLGSRLILMKEEPLIDDGWNWLIKAVERKKITALDASSGQQLTSDDIQRDYQRRKNSSHETELSVIIERSTSRFPMFGSGGYRQLNEMVYVVDGNEGLD